MQNTKKPTENHYALPQTNSQYNSCHNTTSNVEKIYSILEIKSHKTKLPFSKVMLHSAPQIKLWGGEDLEVKKENALSKLHLNPQKTFLI